MSTSVCILRHELPKDAYRFTIDTHGFKPLVLMVEEDIPVIYEIGILSTEDHKPWSHKYMWIQTGSTLPEGLSSSTYVGTVQFLDGRVSHLFQDWGT